MIAVAVCHRYGGSEENREAAKRWIVWLAELGYAPLCTWVTLTEHWDESRREHGLDVDFELIRRADVVLLCGPEVSDGMRQEYDFADEISTPVVDLTGYPPVLPEARYAQAVMTRINKAVCP